MRGSENTEVCAKFSLLTALNPHMRVAYNFPLSPTLPLSLSEEKSVVWEISNPRLQAQEDSEDNLDTEDEYDSLVPYFNLDYEYLIFTNYFLFLCTF